MKAWICSTYCGAVSEMRPAAVAIVMIEVYVTCDSIPDWWTTSTLARSSSGVDGTPARGLTPSTALAAHQS